MSSSRRTALTLYGHAAGEEFADQMVIVGRLARDRRHNGNAAAGALRPEQRLGVPVEQGFAFGEPDFAAGVGRGVCWPAGEMVEDAQYRLHAREGIGFGAA